VNPSNACVFNLTYLYALQQYCAAHKESEMIRALERFFDALFAPLARELARMPSSALHLLLPGF